MTTTTASAQIIAACDEVFQKGWEAQVEYLRGRFVEYEKALELAAADKAAKPLFSIRLIDAKTFFYRAIYGVEKGSPYMDLKAQSRANFDELCAAMGGIKTHGFDGYVAKERADYIEFLTAYLRLSLEKKDIQTYPEATDIEVKGSAKGYKITAYVGHTRLVTDCIPVGGYNIVRFHYRYTVKF